MLFVRLVDHTLIYAPGNLTFVHSTVWIESMLRIYFTPLSIVHHGRLFKHCLFGTFQLSSASLCSLAVPCKRCED